MKNRYVFSAASRTLNQIFLVLSCLFAANTMAAESKYETEVAKWQTHDDVAKWQTHDDVAKWLKSNFVFDKNRQAEGLLQLKKTGPENILTRKPETLFENHNGYCRDSAGFAKDALNRVNPRHQARYIFIKNKYGPPNHWVTGFKVDNKLYVIDYGAGKHWRAMKGVHGPYESLEGYKTFLASLSLQGFAPEMVKWRDIPGRED